MNTAGQGYRKTHYSRPGAEGIKRERLNIKKNEISAPQLDKACAGSQRGGYLMTLCQ